MATLLKTWGTNCIRSGTGTPSSTNDVNGRIKVYLESQNVSNNTSLIRIDHYMVFNSNINGILVKDIVSKYRANVGSQGGTYQQVTLPQKGAAGTHSNAEYTVSSNYYSTYHTIYHNADGTGQLYVNGSFKAQVMGNNGSNPVTATRTSSFNLALPTIPRRTTINTFTLDNATVNSIRIKWATEHTVSHVWYRIGSGSWVLIAGVDGNKSGNYTIPSLTPNTSYSIDISVRRKDSGVDTYSSKKSLSTIDIARLTGAGTATTMAVPSTMNIAFTNPSGLPIRASIYKPDGVTSIASYRTITTSPYTFEFTETELNNFYDAIPANNPVPLRVYLQTQSPSGNYLDFVVRNFYVDNANPVFTNFTYANTDKILPKGMNERTLTGSATKFIKGYSDIVATITGGNLAVAQKGASMKEYKLEIQGMTPVTTTASSNVTITKENITNELVTVRAVDTRENNTPVTKTIDLINYNPIVINNVTVEREDGGVSGLVKLSFNGTWCNCNFGAMNNTVDAIYEYKMPSDTEWELGLTDIVVTKSGNDFSVSNLSIKGDKNSSGFTQGQSFDFRVTVTDQVERFTFTTVLNSGTPNMALHKDGTAIGGMYDDTLGKGVQLYGDNLYYNKNPLINSGSNANGYYMKYYDGTLVQWGLSVAPVSVSYSTLTFPVSFVDTNYFVKTTHKYIGADGGSTQLRLLNTVEFNGASGCYIFSVYSDGTIPAFKRTIMYQATGRWK